MTGIWSVLGLTGYYRRFISLTALNTSILSQKLPWRQPHTVADWTTAIENGFVLEEMLYVPFPVEPHPHTYINSFLLQTNASLKRDWWHVECQMWWWGTPSCLLSHKLVPRERNYVATELEGLAITDSVEHFGIYLMGQLFTIETYHWTLSFLLSAKTMNGCLAHWALKLQPYSFQFK